MPLVLRIAPSTGASASGKRDSFRARGSSGDAVDHIDPRGGRLAGPELGVAVSDDDPCSGSIPIDHDHRAGLPIVESCDDACHHTRRAKPGRIGEPSHYAWRKPSTRLSLTLPATPATIGKADVSGWPRRPVRTGGTIPAAPQQEVLTLPWAWERDGSSPDGLVDLTPLAVRRLDDTSVLRAIFHMLVRGLAGVRLRNEVDCLMVAMALADGATDDEIQALDPIREALDQSRNVATEVVDDLTLARSAVSRLRP